MALQSKMDPYVDMEAERSLNDVSKIDTDKDSDTSSESDLFISRRELLKRKSAARVWPWILATTLLAALSLLLGLSLFLQRIHPERILGCRQTDLSSDFPAAREAIELREVKFTGNTAFYANGSGYVPNPSPVRYFGDPSPEVDQAWEELSGSRDFHITESEAKELWPNDYQDHWDRAVSAYPVGLDMFHTLHCLNDVRRLFFPDYYPVTARNRAAQDKHRDHCLDQIRQYIMCAGDMTAYGSRYYEGIGRNYADSDVTHVCRNFDKLLEWKNKRYHAGGELHIPGVDVWE